MIYFFFLYSFLTIISAKEANFKPPLPAQERKTLINQASGVYSIIKKMIIKDDENKYNEDWYNNNNLKKNKLTGDISSFGSEIKSIVKKHHFTIYGSPYNVQGIPIIYPSKGTGINLGVKLNFYNLEFLDPYKYSIALQYWSSDRGRANHKIKVDIPHFFNSNWRLILNAYYNYNINSSFVGIGNNSNFDPNLSDPRSSTYINRNYYNFKNREPGAGIELRRKILENLSIFSGFDSRNYEIFLIDETNDYYIKNEQPYGIDGGIISYLKLGLIYDSTNYPTNPESGNKLVFTLSDFFGDYSFYGANFTWATFYTPSKYFTIASRLMSQQMYGEVPFFALSYFVGDDFYKGLGGEDSLRGEIGNRYIDKFKIVEQLEFRINFYLNQIKNQLLKMDLVPFIDFGTVATNYTKTDLNKISFSYGSAFRVIWNKNFLVNFTFGMSQDNWTTYLSFGENF